jgi:hypothetical protein
MHLAKRLFLLLPMVGLLASCSEDFEVAAPYKPVTVIYGLLNASDTAHYIRIQKAFLDENKSAFDLAKIPDSNFYASLTVHLKEFSGGSLRSDEILPRVDLNGEGFPKDTGIFFNAPNYAYKSRRTLVPGNTYRLVVSNAATGEVDSAETPIIGTARTEFLVNEFYSSYELSFPASRDDNPFALTPQGSDKAYIFEGIIRFHYVNRIGNVETSDSVDWNFATTSREESPMLLRTTQRSFYTFLKSAIRPAPANVTRYMDSADIFVWAGGKTMSDYLKINNAQGGITADQIKPIYTNIKGANVYGLFSTRTRLALYKVPINDITLDSLIKSPITSDLVIRGRSIR